MNLQDWVGNTEVSEDVVVPTPARALAATLDLDGCAFSEGDVLPPLWHWLYFLPLVPMSGVGPDGHPARGGFLPPVPLERRMWAGSQLEFRDVLRVGDAVSKASEVLEVQEKSGKSGPLVFVTVQHTTSTARGVAIQETQNIVYLEMPTAFTPPRPNPLPDALDWQETQDIDPVRLFRFSALTFNGHRIHYDRTYAMDVERYPGLVVHGPLQAILLLESARRHQAGRDVARYEFRATRPIFDHDTLQVAGVADGAGHRLYTANGDGNIGTQSFVTWQD